MTQENKDYIDEIAKKLSAFIEKKIEENGHCSLYEANKEMYRLLNGGEDCVDIEIAVEKLVEDKLTPEEKKKLSLEISATLTDIMFSVRKLQHKAKIYRDMANKGRR